MAEQSALVRQWILLRTLSARRDGATVKELVAELGVSEKTVRRDLETFLAVGFPLEETVERFGRKKWRVDPEKTQPGMTFTFDEAIALYLGRRFLEPLAGTLLWEAAQRAYRKIRATLSVEAVRYLEKFVGMFHQTAQGAGDYSKKADIIDRLMIGIEDRRTVFITYQSMRSTEPVSYPTYPYGIVFHRGALYLIGWAPDHNAIRHWKIARIEEAELTEVHFERLEQFDLGAHLSKSFGVYRGAGDGDVHVKVRFAPAVARYVAESRWHASQKLTKQKDGGLLAEFDLSSTEEIKRWVLSFGSQAEVLEPDGLRKEMGEEAQSLMKSYEKRDLPDGAEPGPRRRRNAPR